MLDKLKKETNYTRTENDALTHKTTESYLLDFFALGGALRNRTETDIISIFSKAFSEDSSNALKVLFYFRDIRGGQGERNTFKTVLKYLGNNYSDRLKPLLQYIPEYGRWDDMFILLDTELKKDVVNILKEQLEKDINSDTPSLLAKWMPSINTSSEKSIKLAKRLKKELGYKNIAKYRKTLSSLRNKIKIIESKMSANEWEKIEYDKIPSKAGLKYRKAFSKHDEERYKNYLESVKKGEKKINVKTLYPYEIYEKCRYNDEALNVMWDNLPNYVKEDEDAIVVADVSGSMNGRPMAVSVSLALYFAQHNKGKFKNHFITFSNRPELVEVVGNTLYEKFMNIENANWDMNTNVEAVFDLILNTAIKHKIPQNELPAKLYIISDMEFDECTNYNSTIYQHVKNKFKEHDYKLPELVFWNVDARHNQVPVTMHDIGVQLVSGCSPVLFEQIVSGKSAYDLMMKVIGTERYKVIE